MGYEIRNFLFYYYIDQYHDRNWNLLPVERQKHPGEFIQAAYRSSAALLGIAFIQNIYGNSGQAPLMIIGSVPLYNIMAVVVLSFFKPGQNGMDKALLKKH